MTRSRDGLSIGTGTAGRGSARRANSRGRRTARTWPLPRPSGNDRGRDDDDHFLRVGAELAALEQPAEYRDAPQERDLPQRFGVVVGQDATDDEPLTLPHDDLVLRSTLEDRRVALHGLREVRLVVLDEHLHPYPRDVGLANDPRGHFELEQRVLELHLRPSEAALAHVRDLETARDDGCRILHGDRLGLRDRPRLALRLERRAR